MQICSRTNLKGNLANIRKNKHDIAINFVNFYSLIYSLFGLLIKIKICNKMSIATEQDIQEDLYDVLYFLIKAF